MLVIVGYSNCELSVDRANASRRELIAGSMEEENSTRGGAIFCRAVR